MRQVRRGIQLSKRHNNIRPRYRGKTPRTRNYNRPTTNNRDITNIRRQANQFPILLHLTNTINAPYNPYEQLCNPTRYTTNPNIRLRPTKFTNIRPRHHPTTSTSHPTTLPTKHSKSPSLYNNLFNRRPYIQPTRTQPNAKTKGDHTTSQPKERPTTPNNTKQTKRRLRNKRLLRPTTRRHRESQPTKCNNTTNRTPWETNTKQPLFTTNLQLTNDANTPNHKPKTKAIYNNLDYFLRARQLWLRRASPTSPHSTKDNKRTRTWGGRGRGPEYEDLG